MSDKYLSYHLYYNSDYFEIVKEIHTILAQYNVFGVHYKDNKGYHVRIRIKNEAIFCDSKNILLEKLNKINNIVDIIENVYYAENERYGEDNIEIIERLFELFTKLIYQIISDSDKWKYENSLFMSLAVNMAFLNSFNNERFIFECLKDGFQGWLPYALYLTNDDSQRLIELFKQKFQNDLSNWRKVEKVKTFISEEFDNYFSEIKEIYTKIIMQNNADKLIEITSSIIHMNHNRFGIYNRDEAYMFFVLNKLCKKN